MTKLILPILIGAAISADAFAQESIEVELERLAGEYSCELERDLISGTESFFLSASNFGAAVAWCHKPFTTATGMTIPDYTLLVLTRDSKNAWAKCPSNTRAPFSSNVRLEIQEPIFVDLPFEKPGLEKFALINGDARVGHEAKGEPTGPAIAGMSDSRNTGSYLYCHDGEWYYWGFH